MEEKLNKLEQRILDIELQSLRGLIPTILLNKLLFVDLKTINDFLEFPSQDFLRIRGVGKHCNNLFFEIKQDIHKDPELFYNNFQNRINTPAAKRCLFTKKLEYLLKVNSLENLSINPDHKILSINICDVAELINPRLINHFKKMNVQTIGDVMQISGREFLIEYGVNIITLKNFFELKIKISKKPDATFEEYSTHIMQLLQNGKLLIRRSQTSIPLNESDLKDQSLLEIFKAIVVDYAGLNLKNHYGQILLMNYGINSERFSRKQISLKYSFTRERIRQIIQMGFEDIRALLNGQKLSKLNIILRTDILESFKEIIDESCEQSFRSREEIVKYFSTKIGDKTHPENERLIYLFSSIFYKTIFWNSEARQKAKQMLSLEKIILDEAKELNPIITKILRQSSLPLTENEIFEKTIIATTGFSSADIRIVLQHMPAVTTIQSGDQQMYQIIKSKKRQCRDMIYEILKKNREVMSMKKILEELIKTPVYEPGAVYSSTSLYLAQDKRFQPLQKSGWWSLAEWNIHPERLVDIVKRIIVQKDRPVTGGEIISEVLKIRPQTNLYSIKTLVDFLCVTAYDTSLKNKFKTILYYLPEWKSRYPKLYFRSQKKLEIDYSQQFEDFLIKRITEILKNNNNNPLSGKEIKKAIISEYPGATKYMFKKIFSDEKHFLIMKTRETFSKLKLK